MAAAVTSISLITTSFGHETGPFCPVQYKGSIKKPGNAECVLIKIMA